MLSRLKIGDLGGNDDWIELDLFVEGVLGHMLGWPLGVRMS